MNIGDKIQISPSMSSTGRYGKHLGKYGEITAKGTVILVNEKKIVMDRETLTTRLDELSLEFDTLQEQLRALDSLGVDSLTMQQQRAIKLINAMDQEVTLERIDAVAAAL